MKFLAPLGLIALASIIALILIYIIKPNYQQKTVSSTFVWKLSLKYRKKRRPVNKLNNILVIICQILALALSALIIAQPYKDILANMPADEAIAIIDASGNMWAEYDDETRFERAVKKVKTLAKDLRLKQGILTVILAHEQAEQVVWRQKITSQVILQDINAKLDDLIIPGKERCSYGIADVTGAMKMSEDVLDINQRADVIYYTATSYMKDGFVQVDDVSQPNEWNAAIMNAYAEVVENNYAFTAEVASFGAPKSLIVSFKVNGINGADPLTNYDVWDFPVNCNGSGDRVTVVLNTSDYDKRNVYSYDSVEVTIRETGDEEGSVLEDALNLDNTYCIYGGVRPTLNVMYWSARPNIFFSSALLSVKNIIDTKKKQYTVHIEESSDNSVLTDLSGYDLYIFEHYYPETLPTDGVILLINPDRSSDGLGFSISHIETGSFTLSPGVDHPITKDMQVDRIEITQYLKFNYLSQSFKTLMYCGGDPILLAKEEGDQQLVLLSFSLNYSSFPLRADFPIFLYNCFQHFLPTTVEGNSFSVNESITLRARGESITVKATNSTDEITYTEFPTQIKLSTPGTYELHQVFRNDQIKDQIDKIFVKLPESVSNIFAEEDILENPMVYTAEGRDIIDLLIYFAIAIVAILFVEWILQLRINFAR